MKILIIAGYTPSLVNFRGDLIKDMLRLGHEVITAGPELDCEKEIRDLGASFVQIPIERTSANPIKDILLVNEICKLIKSQKPDLVFGYTIKPVVYASIAARIVGVRRIFSMVTGLGYTFLGKGIKAWCIRILSKCLYYIAFKCSKKVFFQNPDDMNEFIKKGLIKKDKITLINGSGVNLSQYKPTQLPEEPVFLMVCRILKDKGVMEYLEAARQVKRSNPEARFQLLGPFDTNPNSLNYSDLKPYIDDGSIEYLGETKDVRPYIANCFVYVLPSYREGTPRTVLEAMAMSRPIITTNVPGCRETVIDGINGFLVTVKNTQKLAEKMIWMIENRGDAVRMAEESLRICLTKYDVNKVNHIILNSMGL